MTGKLRLTFEETPFNFLGKGINLKFKLMFGLLSTLKKYIKWSCQLLSNARGPRALPFS